MNKFFIKSFGCQININDSKIISKILIKNDFIKNKNIKNSNIIIINTCSIRENSHKKLYKYLNKIKKLKNILIIISGCISSYLAKYLIYKYNFINIVLNPKNIYFLPNLIKMYYYNKCKQIKINFYNYKDYNNFEKKFSITSNYITISDGCSKYCSYCIVPYTRGIEISFCLNLIINKILILNKNFKYICLLGQNVNSYLGKLKLKSNKYVNFSILLNYINQIFFIKYINFITSHPIDFNQELINNYKINFKLFNLLHLPIQSCSNKILKLMRRNYKLLYYKIIFNKLKKIRYSIIFNTDIILCFPSENNCDFYKTLIFIEKFLFDNSYIFIYSPRPYTKSYNFINKISNNLKFKRFNIINFKIKNNIKYINKMLLNKLEFVYIKNYYLLSSFMYISITNNNKIVYFLYDIKWFFINKIIKLKLKKFYKGLFYGIILN